MSDSVQIAVSTNFWMVWSEIALAEVRATREGHAEALASVARGDGFTGGELRHALVAVIAAAFAVDGFYGATRDMCKVPENVVVSWKDQDAPRAVRVFSTLHHGFKMSNTQAKDWKKEINWLFGLRDRAAHHEPEHLPPVYRAEFDSGFSHEHAIYTAETATRAVGFAFELIETCLRNPRSHTRSWAEANAHVADLFASHRDSLSH